MAEIELFRIKPLEWEPIEGSIDGVLRARGVFFKSPVYYAVVFQEEGPDGWSGWQWYATKSLCIPCASLEEGKQLAEAHWREYVKQALESVESTFSND